MREFEFTLDKVLIAGLRAWGPKVSQFTVFDSHNVGPSSGGTTELHERVSNLTEDLAWGGLGQEVTPSTTRNITIVVRDYVSDDKLEAAQISIDGVYVGVADANGEFQVQNIELGGHSIQITLDGYLDTTNDTLVNDFFVVT